MNKNRIVKSFVGIVMSVLFVMTTLAPAGYATGAEYDRKSESLQEVLDLYGKKLRDVEKASYVSAGEMDVETYVNSRQASAEMEASDTVRLTFDDNLVIEMVGDEVESFSNFTPITDSVLSVSDTDDLDDVIKAVTEIADLDSSYEIIHSIEFDEDYWRIAWAKRYGELLNTYEAVNVVVNRRTGEIVVYKRFDDVPNTLVPEITEAEALSAIADILEDNGVDVDSVEGTLTFRKPNIAEADSVLPYSSEDVRLAYLFSVFEGSVYLCVDAVTGDLICYSEARDTSKAFSISDDGDFNRAQDQVDWATYCYAYLGYSALYPRVLGNSATLKTEILSFINRSDAYGFYLACHGTPTITNNSCLYDYTASGNGHAWDIYSSDIVGNWKFVFLDGCYTGQTPFWANAFNIYNTSSNRAFLGWDQEVHGEYVVPFSEFLFYEITQQLHSDNIRDAAVWAAAQVPNPPAQPDVPSTPIRFYGDRTYDGRI